MAQQAAVPPAGDVAQSRLTQVFKFLKALNELRNPVPRDLSAYSQILRLDAWPLHPNIIVQRGDREDEEDDADTDAEMEPIIRIQRARLTSCPSPPARLDGWLKPNWQIIDAEVEVLESRNFINQEKETITVGFVDAPERVEALNLWKATRAEWALAERPAIAARQLFERIHALWTTMQREGDRVELVLADGMLDEATQLIRHPVLMQRVNFEFDPAVPEFRFSAGTEKVELHRALLRLVPSIEARMITYFDKQLDAHPVEPLGGESTIGFLRSLVQGIFNDGEFLDAKAQGTTAEHPTIWREPVIFLRPRIAGLNTTLDFILEDLEGEVAIPEGLSGIVGVETDGIDVSERGLDEETAPAPSAAEPDILFSKPANREQYEIAARLAKARAVLVQGPPGTGKTHTIANLLGYLLAQGKTVLVTAHTTKALRVLREKIDKGLQPLCLSVLGRDSESQNQMKESAQEIANRLSSSNAASLRKQAALLRDKRRQLLEVAASLRRQLRDARFSEVEEIVIGGEGLSPIEVAKRVRVDADRDDWIPGPLQSGVLCPLSESEVRQLYATHATLTISDEAQLTVPQPSLAHIVSAADFRLLANERAGTDSRAKSHRADLWLENAGTGYSAAQLQELHQRVCAASSVLTEKENWLREVLFAGWMGGDHRGTWDDLLGYIDSLAAEAATATRLQRTHGPELPKGRPVAQVAATLDEIISHLEGGHSFGLMTKLRHRDWRELIELCCVEGRIPQTVDEFRALRAVARLQENRDRFAGRWRRAVESLGGPQLDSLGNSPERAAQSYAAEIRNRLEWRAMVWEPLTEELRSVGFRWGDWLATHMPVPGDHGEIARVQRAGSQGLAEIVEAQAALIRQVELSAALQSQRTYLAGFPQSDSASVLLMAQDSWDPENYEAACRELARSEGLHSAYDTRSDLLDKMVKVAPAWAHAIFRRQKPHDTAQPPGNCVTAWRWRQWCQELERRASVSMTDLQERLDKTENELREGAAQIIERETWAAQCERTGLRAKQALMGFVQTIRKIGKGTGKRVPELLRQARQLLASARQAVPVWIMPLSRVYENFDPRVTKFDVVIIDEASQSDVTALAALYLGRDHVVVGDKEQVTPDAVGQRVDEVVRLISTDLQGIPNSHLYDGQTSIYDLAETAFGGVVALREHFRCVPEIIQFSNHLSYNNSIRPLREPFSSPVRPALIPHRVHGFRSKGQKSNDVEAEEIASLVVACLTDPAYEHNDLGQPTTFGVISLLGDEQALLIENMLRIRLSPDVFAKHRLLCGNAAQFQGDERDVVFLSMVDGPPEDGQLRMMDAGPNGLYKKRYNVAVSRARNQLWLVHSLDVDRHLKSGDLRRRLLDHAHDPQALLREMEIQGSRVDSPFEKQVMQRLVAAGYRVRSQWPVGAYRIDLVVEGLNRKLAVECDGEKWHTPEQLQDDLERQAILERLGWVFVRIRGSLFFRDADAAIAPVFAKLEHLDIEALGPVSQAEAIADSPLVEQVRRKAEALRAAWLTEKTLASEIDTSSEAEIASPSPSQEGPTPIAKNQDGVQQSPAASANALSIEVGDSVAFTFANEPADENWVTIVSGESNPKLGLINKETPIARVVLGASVGAELFAHLPDGTRRIKILTIQKHRPAFGVDAGNER
jgi:very-short-patch-repair endonuclease